MYLLNAINIVFDGILPIIISFGRNNIDDARAKARLQTTKMCRFDRQKMYFHENHVKKCRKYAKKQNEINFLSNLLNVGKSDCRRSFFL